MWFGEAVTTTGSLELTFFLFHRLSKGRHFAFNDFMLSKQIVQGADLVDVGGQRHLRFL
jgi:hypothetical protein